MYIRDWNYHAVVKIKKMIAAGSSASWARSPLRICPKGGVGALVGNVSTTEPQALLQLALGVYNLVQKKSNRTVPPDYLRGKLDDAWVACGPLASDGREITFESGFQGYMVLDRGGEVRASAGDFQGVTDLRIGRDEALIAWLGSFDSESADKTRRSHLDSNVVRAIQVCGVPNPNTVIEALFSAESVEISLPAPPITTDFLRKSWLHSPETKNSQMVCGP